MQHRQRSARSSLQLAEPTPIGRDIAGVANRDEELGRSLAERLGDLEGGRLLPFDAMRIDGVHERDSGFARRLEHQSQGLIEGAFDHDNLRTVCERLRQLAGGDTTGWDHDDGAQAAMRGVGRGGRTGIARRRAE